MTISASHPTRGAIAKRKACATFALLVLLGACKDWARDNPLDPGRCSPRCSGGQICRDGKCETPSPDGAGADLPRTDGIVHDSVPHDAPPQARLVVRTYAGTGTAGLVNGAAASAQFRDPTGIALSGAKLYVADVSNNVIRLIQNGQVSTFAGSGMAGYLDSLAPLQAQFNAPNDVIESTASGGVYVYIADTLGHRIRAVLPTNKVTTLAGNGLAGYQDAPGKTAMFSSPTGVAWAPAVVYVADLGNCRLRKITGGSGETITTVAGGSCGSATGPALQAQFKEIVDVVLDSAGNLYIADRGNHDIRLFAGGTVSKVAGTGVKGFRDGAALEAQFDTPNALTVDSAGKIYVADTGNNRIRVIDKGQVSTLAGSGTAGFLDGDALEAQFNSPEGIAVDGAGKVYVSDRVNNRIRVIELSIESAPAASTR